MKSWKSFPLQTRLGLLYAALLITSVALVSSYSYWNTWQLLVDGKVCHIRARAKPIIEHWLDSCGLSGSDSAPIAINSKDALILACDLTSRSAVAVILDSEGRVIANGKRLSDEPTAPTPDLRYVRKAFAGENEVTYKSVVNGDSVLVLLIPIRPQPTSGHILGVIQISTSLADTSQVLFHRGAILAAIVGIILVLGILAGCWLIDVSLRDLRALSGACEQISKGNFEQRARLEERQDEIGRLARSFNEMADHLESSFTSQRRFVSNAAHELLTPLTGLRGSLEVLLRGSQDDPVAVDALSKGMYKEVDRLIRVCERLLGISRLESAANLQKKSIVLADFVEDFKQQVQILMQNCQLAIYPGPSVNVSADPDLLKQVLFDLLANAMRHSPPSSPVSLGWKVLSSQVELWFSDAGEGMDSETMSHAFEPFFQGKSSVPVEEKGIGLGLTIVKSVIEAHGGSIRLESEPGKGTTVYFSLPLDKPYPEDLSRES